MHENWKSIDFTMTFMRDPATERNALFFVSFKPSKARCHFATTNPNIDSFMVAAMGPHISPLNHVLLSSSLAEGAKLASAFDCWMKHELAKRNKMAVKSCLGTSSSSYETATSIYSFKTK